MEGRAVLGYCTADMGSGTHFRASMLHVWFKAEGRTHNVSQIHFILQKIQCRCWAV